MIVKAKIPILQNIHNGIKQINEWLVVRSASARATNKQGEEFRMIILQYNRLEV